MKVLVFYPWGGVLTRRTGGDLRVGLLIDCLKEIFDEVTVVYPDGESRRIENVSYIGFRQSKWNFRLSRLIRFSLKLFFLFKTQKKAGTPLSHLWLYHRYKYDKDFKNLTYELISNTDLVFCEYFHFSNIVCDTAKKMEKKVILTNYDVISDQVQNNTFLKKRIFKREVEALFNADYPVVLTENDAEIFAGAGVAGVITISNGIDYTKIKSMICSREFIIKQFKDIYDIDIESQRICLFIGSSHPANLEAAVSYKQIAKIYNEKYHNKRISFLIAGNCCSVDSTDDWKSLGVVEDIALHYLYQIADLIIIPLSSGTGASLKTIEALAYGKTIIGTRVAFRGVPVSDKVDSIICDDYEDYPELINKYIDNNSEEKKKISKNAESLGLQLDYRKKYLKYYEIIEKIFQTSVGRPELRLLNVNETIKKYEDINLFFILKFFPDSDIYNSRIVDYWYNSILNKGDEL